MMSRSDAHYTHHPIDHLYGVISLEVEQKEEEEKEGEDRLPVRPGHTAHCKLVQRSP